MNLSISLDQITVNDYPPNGGIPAHTDSHSPFKEIFVSLSLLHGTSMVFEKDFGNAQENI
jgi:alkylated DNA repair dioxygenase AlkB